MSQISFLVLTLKQKQLQVCVCVWVVRCLGVEYQGEAVTPGRRSRQEAADCGWDNVVERVAVASVEEPNARSTSVPNPGGKLGRRLEGQHHLKKRAENKEMKPKSNITKALKNCQHPQK